ncbi:MAG: carbohydrate porin [Candidatus Omnitrophica bacterium]|nr:carbohydrate porin [Candidatus Omnitrophota bacterium]
MKKLRRLLLILNSLLVSFAMYAEASEIPLWEKLTLKECRSKLEEKGYSFGLDYTGDITFNKTGGTKRGDSYLGLLDSSLEIDTSKASLWEGGTFFINTIYTFGNGFPSADFTGDMQGLDNIEAPRLFRLFEVWYEQRFINDKLSARGGLYDINSEFNVTDYGSLFINSSFGLNPAVSLNTTASTYPLAAPGLRLKLDPNEHLSLLSAILSGDPGDENNNPHGLNPVWNNERGTFAIYEIQIKGNTPLLYGDLPGTIKIGGWYNSKNTDDLTDTDGNGDPIKHNGNRGIYAIIDQMLFKENENENEGLGIFFQYGQSPEDRNTIDSYIGLGINYTGLFPNRNEDVFGLAFGRASSGNSYRLTGDFDKEEDIIEATYLIHLHENISLQPDYQVIYNPSVDPSIKNTQVAVLRLNVSF